MLRKKKRKDKNQTCKPRVAFKTPLFMVSSCSLCAMVWPFSQWDYKTAPSGYSSGWAHIMSSINICRLVDCTSYKQFCIFKQFHVWLSDGKKCKRLLVESTSLKKIRKSLLVLLFKNDLLGLLQLFLFLGFPAPSQSHSGWDVPQDFGRIVTPGFYTWLWHLPFVCCGWDTHLSESPQNIHEMRGHIVYSRY